MQKNLLPFLEIVAAGLAAQRAEIRLLACDIERQSMAYAEVTTELASCLLILEKADGQMNLFGPTGGAA